MVRKYRKYDSGCTSVLYVGGQIVKVHAVHQVHIVHVLVVLAYLGLSLVVQWCAKVQIKVTKSGMVPNLPHRIVRWHNLVQVHAKCKHCNPGAKSDW